MVRSSRLSFQRPRARRNEKATVFIYCEGQDTERIYLDGLKKIDEIAKNFDIKIKRGKGGDRDQIVTRAWDAIQSLDYQRDHCYCVMDVETVAARGSLDKAVKIASANNIKLILSNPAFEVWLRSHFVRSSAAFDNCDHVITDLNKYWRKNYKIDYSKSDDTIFNKLSCLIDDAVSNSAQVLECDHSGCSCQDANSSSEVYKLVNFLLKKR